MNQRRTSWAVGFHGIYAIAEGGQLVPWQEPEWIELWKQDRS